MPSGDAFQSAVFVTFLCYLGINPILLAIFHIGVCTGRVYYMCHWVSDTMVSTGIGMLVGNFLLSPGIQRFFYNLPGELL
jgi:membrane-associated phospholipid phosphatase